MAGLWDSALHRARKGEETPLRARMLLDRPQGMRLRLVECDDGRPDKVNGQHPHITEIRQELDGQFDHIYIVTEDDPDEAFRLLPDDDVTVIPLKG